MLGSIKDPLGIQGHEVETKLAVMVGFFLQPHSAAWPARGRQRVALPGLWFFQEV